MITEIESMQGASHQKVVATKINPRHFIDDTYVAVGNLNCPSKINLAVTCTAVLASGSVCVGSIDNVDERLACVGICDEQNGLVVEFEPTAIARYP